MRTLYIAVIATLALLVPSTVAQAQGTAAPTTFVVMLAPENQVPVCEAGVESGATGVAIVQINAETGEITYRVVATNLPGTIAGAPGSPRMRRSVAPSGSRSRRMMKRRRAAM